MDRITQSIDNSVNFCGLSTPAGSDILVVFRIYSPFFAPALCGCALMEVLSMHRFSYKSYLNLKDVEVRAKKYTNGDLHWLHTALSNLKNLLRGTYHGRCAKLQPYLDEFCFRFNRRMCAGQIFSRLTRAVAASGSVLS